MVIILEEDIIKTTVEFCINKGSLLAGGGQPLVSVLRSPFLARSLCNMQPLCTHNNALFIFIFQ